jgi:UDP-N-acetylmuramate: L-alanyl-gamma-D-glutamyl-meso-diaminopimelate ligase
MGDVHARELTFDEHGSHFIVVYRKKEIARWTLGVWGRHNVENALGAASAGLFLGLTPDELGVGMKSFQGVRRRQQLLGTPGGIALIDDFAHHPTAVRETLSSVRSRFPGRRVIAIFEPRSNTSRRNVFQADFERAFDRAARVYLGPVYFKPNDPIPEAERLHIEPLARAISQRGPLAIACESPVAILERILADSRPGDIVVFMSNGPFDNLPRRLLAALKART